MSSLKATSGAQRHLPKEAGLAAAACSNVAVKAVVGYVGAAALKPCRLHPAPPPVKIPPRVVAAPLQPARMQSTTHQDRFAWSAAFE